MRKYWFSCSRFTIQVNVDQRGVIIWTAPIARKFIGQPLANLMGWQPSARVKLMR